MTQLLKSFLSILGWTSIKIITKISESREQYGMIKTLYNKWIDLWPFSFCPPDLGGCDGESGKLRNKLGRVVKMVVDSILLHAECRTNDHRKDAPPFSNKILLYHVIIPKHKFLSWIEIFYRMPTESFTSFRHCGLAKNKNGTVITTSAQLVQLLKDKFYRADRNPSSENLPLSKLRFKLISYNL